MSNYTRIQLGLDNPEMNEYALTYKHHSETGPYFDFIPENLDNPIDPPPLL